MNNANQLLTMNNNTNQLSNLSNVNPVTMHNTNQLPTISNAIIFTTIITTINCLENLFESILKVFEEKIL